MIDIQLSGEWPQHHKYQDFAEQVMEYLLYEEYDTYIDITLMETCDDQAAGYCHGDNYHVIIDLAQYSQGEAYTPTEIARNLAHELVHASQNILTDGQAEPPEVQESRERQALAWENKLVEMFWQNED